LGEFPFDVTRKQGLGIVWMLSFVWKEDFRLVDDDGKGKFGDHLDGDMVAYRNR
jgi:hypothetical protein